MPEPLTLEGFLSQVRAGNTDLQSSKLRAEALEQRIDPAGALDDPFVAAGVDDVPFRGGGDYIRRYQVSQSIPFPGKRAAREAIAEHRAFSKIVICGDHLVKLSLILNVLAFLRSF